MAGTDKPQRPRVPLLEAYIKELPSYPDHMPTWINYVGWIVGLTGSLISINYVHSNVIGIIISVLLALAAVQALRARYRARNEKEKAEEHVFKVVRRLKFTQHDGSGLRGHLPREVLLALEDAVTAHNVAMARASVDHSYEGIARQESLTRAMHACLLATVPVIRGQDVGKKDWDAICNNRVLINDVLETIHVQTVAMREPFALSDARIAALQELNEELTAFKLDQRG